MEVFLKQRRQDPRFLYSNNRVEAFGTQTPPWYTQSTAPRFQGEVHTFTFSASKESSEEEAKKKKAEKKKKRSDSDTSDGSDGGRCWSDYEPTPGKKAYEKGSCRPEKKKKT